MLIFVVARSRLDRYEELRRHFEDCRDVRIVLSIVGKGNDGQPNLPLLEPNGGDWRAANGCRT